MKSLNTKAFGGLVFVLVVMAALLFLSAWTLHYWQAWAFLAMFEAAIEPTRINFIAHGNCF